MRRTLRRTEAHYLLNRIFLDDYCAFLQQRERAEPVLALLRADLEGEAARMVGKGDVGLDLLGLEALVVDGAEEEEDSSQSGSESEGDSSEESESDSESDSGGEGSEADASDNEEEEEEEEGENALVAGLQRVRLVEEAEGTDAGTGRATDSGWAEGQEGDEGLVGQLAAMSVGGDKHRETLDVRPLPSLLLAPQQPEGEELPEEKGKTWRPLVEEL